MSSRVGKGMLHFTDGTSLEGSYRITRIRKGSNRLHFASWDILNPALNKEVAHFVSDSGHLRINEITVEKVRSTSKNQVIICRYIPR